MRWCCSVETGLVLLVRLRNSGDWHDRVPFSFLSQAWKWSHHLNSCRRRLTSGSSKSSTIRTCSLSSLTSWSQTASEAGWVGPSKECLLCGILKHFWGWTKGALPSGLCPAWKGQQREVWKWQARPLDVWGGKSTWHLSFLLTDIGHHLLGRFPANRPECCFFC